MSHYVCKAKVSKWEFHSKTCTTKKQNIKKPSIASPELMIKTMKSFLSIFPDSFNLKVSLVSSYSDHRQVRRIHHHHHWLASILQNSTSSASNTILCLFNILATNNKCITEKEYNKAPIPDVTNYKIKCAEKLLSTYFNFCPI